MVTLFGDRWEIQAALGEGGQSHTFTVVDRQGPPDQLYVLKRLKNIRRLERFRREIEALHTLNHENIVRLVDFDLEGNRPYLVTEHCAGGSLDRAAPFWKDNPKQAFRLFDQICAGVEFAHSNNLIHRDLKPANIFLRSDTGPAVVGDFGICYLDDEGQRLTLTEEALGPRLYMAPELEDGRLNAISPKTDTYSLGKLLYWLLSGGQIFSREVYRDERWDLKVRNEDSLLGWTNLYLEHANRLLDLMVVHDPDQRRRVSNIRILARRASRLISDKFTPISPGLPQPCTYCGVGQYTTRARGADLAVENSGFKLVGNPDWRIFTCNECGHVQAFRVDLADKKEWWEEGTT
jgi:serine/threonine protein kinase